MAPNYVRGGFTCGAKSFSNKYARTNFSAKFDAFIRDINVCRIFDHNSPDYKQVASPTPHKVQSLVRRELGVIKKNTVTLKILQNLWYFNR